MPTGNHFLTTDTNERNLAVNNDGYHVEQISCHVCPGQVAQSAAFIRLFNPSVNDHFYTTSTAEANNAVAKDGYHIEENACYIFPSQIPNTVPLYRLFNGSEPTDHDHFYTISAAEKNTAAANDGYTYEGVAGYVYASSQPGLTMPFWRLFNEPHPLNQAVSVAINSITYDVTSAVIQQTDQISLYSDDIVNDTSVTQSSTVSGSQSVTDTSGWSDTITVTLQAKANIKVSIPFIANGQIEVTATASNAYTWNGTESYQTSWSWSQPVSVPANSSVQVSIVVSQLTIQVPYTTNATFTFKDGSTVTCETFGTYTGVTSHNLQVTLS